MTELFTSKVKAFGPRMMKDLSATDFQVAGAFGNFGVETGGFRLMQELKPTVKGSRGGWGWPQWTGPRRRAFEAWAATNGFKVTDEEGMYQYLLVELRGPEKAACTAWKRTKSLAAATETFMLKFERPGIPHLDKRQEWAKKALAVLGGTAPVSTRPAKPARAAPPARNAPADKPFVETSAYLKEQSSIGLDPGIIRPLQEKLKELNYYKYKTDGDWGPETRSAVLAWCADHGMDTGTPFLTQPIYTAIMADNQPKGVSKERAVASVSDVKSAAPEVAGAALQQQGIASWLKWAFGGLGGLGIVGYGEDGSVDASSAMSFLGKAYAFLSGVPWPVWIFITVAVLWWSQTSGKAIIEGLRTKYRSGGLLG